MEISCRPTYIEVDLQKLSYNLQVIKKNLAPHVEVMAVVKANGYGHGAIPVAKQALRSGATYLGVATFHEALELREAGIDAPILVLGYTSPNCWPKAQTEEISLTFFEEDHVDQALQIIPNDLKPLKVHVKIDTGMGRIGFRDLDAFLRTCGKITNATQLSFDGLFTHFACADEEDDHFSKQQASRFQEWVKHLEDRGIKPKHIHLNNSAGTIRFPQWCNTLCRVGISQYGLYPSPYLKEQKLISLRPVLSLKSQVVQVKEVPPNTPIGYGGTYKRDYPTRIATIPIGYGDGYSRALSNKGEVLIRGERAQIAGRVAMDQIMVDVTHINGVEAGDEVILIGRQGENEIDADEIASWLNTINYEVTTTLAHRLERRYIHGCF